MEFTLNSNGYLMRVIYFCDYLDLNLIKEKYEDYDYLQVVYPKDVNIDIYNKYRAVMNFIEYGGEWGKSAYSIELSLLDSDEDILKKMSKNTRYKVKRALGKDGLSMEAVMNISEEEMKSYLEFYNSFADLKNLEHIGEAKIRELVADGMYAITKCYSQNGELLVEHAYYLDKEHKRVILSTSSSMYRKKGFEQYKNLIGRANRLLHYQDMLYFKKSGYKVYDFNGISDLTEETKAIADFKRGFGGNIQTYKAGFGIPCRKIKVIDHKLNELIEAKAREKKELIIYGFGEIGHYVKCELDRLGCADYHILDNFSEPSEKQHYYRDADLECIDSSKYP